MDRPSAWPAVLRFLGLETPRPVVSSNDIPPAVRAELARYFDHQEERTRVVVKRAAAAGAVLAALLAWLVLGSAESDFDRKLAEAVAAESITARRALALETAEWRAALAGRNEQILEVERARAAGIREQIRTESAAALARATAELEQLARERGAELDELLAGARTGSRHLGAAVAEVEAETAAARERSLALHTALDELELRLTGDAAPDREALSDSVRAIAAAFDRRALESRAVELWLRAGETSVVAFGAARTVLAARATGFASGSLRDVVVEVWDPAREVGAENGVELALGETELVRFGTRRYAVELVAALDRREASGRAEGNAVQLRIEERP